VKPRRALAIQMGLDPEATERQRRRDRAEERAEREEREDQ